MILKLNEQMELFLDKWAEGMDQANYLKFTTAKREDCIQSLMVFLQPIIAQIRDGRRASSFGELLRNEDAWADALLQVSRRHRFRGVTAGMFCGCFKTFVHSIEHLIAQQSSPVSEKFEAVKLIRRWSDAFETILVEDWTAMTQQQTLAQLADTNRQLTLEKNKYENILAATSDIVLVTDSSGSVIEANQAAHDYLGDKDTLGHRFWEILDLEGADIEEVIRYYAVYDTHEITLFDKSRFFKLRIIPLRSVSLASRGYMVLMTDVTCLVAQRESLEKRVAERTTALSDSEKQYSSLFQAAGSSILLIDINLRVVEANYRSGQIFGIEPEKLIDLDCSEFCHPDGPMTLEAAIRNLDEGEIWEGEMLGQRANAQVFPMTVIINRVDLDTRTLFHVLVWDLTQQKKLEENLRIEKNQLKEMNITLRNVMASIDRENREFLQNTAQKVQELILPALDRIQNEGSPHVRKGYVDIVRDQLLKLTTSTGTTQDLRLLTLTPMEMKICQFVQAGSSSKDIAGSLGLSLDTIRTHRKNMRKKLGLQRRNINLFTFLNNRELKTTDLATTPQIG